MLRSRRRGIPLVGACVILLTMATGSAAIGQSPSPETPAGDPAAAPEAHLALLDSEPVVSELASPDDEHSYWFDGQAGERISITASATDLQLDPVLELYGPRKQWLLTDDDSDGLDAAIGPVLDETGRYVVVVRSAGYGSSGPYRLALVRPSSAQLQVGAGPLTGSLSDIRTADFYPIPLTAGESVGVTLRSGDFDAFLSVYGPDGALLGENDDSDGTDSRLEFVAPVSGTYRIEATSLGQTGSGAYTIEALSSASTGGSSLTPGRWVDGWLDPGGIARYPYSGRQGERVQVSMGSNDFDSYLRILGPDGQEIAMDDDGGGGSSGLDAYVDTRLPSSGVYEVIATTASADGGGSYWLVLDSDR